MKKLKTKPNEFINRGILEIFVKIFDNVCSSFKGRMLMFIQGSRSFNQAQYIYRFYQL